MKQIQITKMIDGWAVLVAYDKWTFSGRTETQEEAFEIAQTILTEFDRVNTGKIAENVI